MDWAHLRDTRIELRLFPATTRNREHAHPVVGVLRPLGGSGSEAVVAVEQAGILLNPAPPRPLTVQDREMRLIELPPQRDLSTEVSACQT